ncbi:MAG: hypothetical protein IE927_10725 [Rhodobacterales bacterium]|nr:hypothetical protein [Rhodobacterales bacterium]
MTEALFALVPVWGAPAIGLITFLSCLALPVPASLAMLAGGAFVAAGDLALAPVARAALAGAVLGEAVWVSLYVGMGWVFAGQITELAATLGNLAGVLAAGAVTALLGRALWQARRRDRAAAAGRRIG